MDRVPYVDQSGLYALEEAILQLEQKEVHVLMTGLHVQPRDMLKRIDIIPDLVPENHLFDDFNHCEDWIHSHIQSNSTAETDTEVGTSEPATTIG